MLPWPFQQRTPTPTGPSELKIKYAENAFKVVVDADIHQDNKANRILSAMAFLTAAAAAAFARVYPAPEKAPFPVVVLRDLNVNLTLLLFIIYLLLVFSGALLFLVALGPSFNLTDKVKNGSLLFFKSIASTDVGSWSHEWGKDDSALRKQLLNNYIFETHAIAQKLETKVGYMSVGSAMFRLALGVLLVFSITFLTGSTLMLLVATAAALVFVGFSFGVLNVRR